MSPKDRDESPRNEPSTGARDPREHPVAPPIEREHETQEGALDEEERRRRERREPEQPERR